MTCRTHSLLAVFGLLLIGASAFAELDEGEQAQLDQICNEWAVQDPAGIVRVVREDDMAILYEDTASNACTFFQAQALAGNALRGGCHYAWKDASATWKGEVCLIIPEKCETTAGKGWCKVLDWYFKPNDPNSAKIPRCLCDISGGGGSSWSVTQVLTIAPGIALLIALVGLLIRGRKFADQS